MPTITLKFKDKVLDTFPVEKGQAVLIGRKETNDIVIDNMAVSGHHASIESVSATFILTDLESTNGTFVNKNLITSHGLRDKDEILIGKHTLVFTRTDLHNKEAENTDDKTRYLETSEYKELIAKASGKSDSKVVKEPEQKGLFGWLKKIFFG